MTGLPWRLVVLLAAVLLGTCAAIVDTTTGLRLQLRRNLDDACAQGS